VGAAAGSAGSFYPVRFGAAGRACGERPMHSSNIGAGEVKDRSSPALIILDRQYAVELAQSRAPIVYTPAPAFTG